MSTTAPSEARSAAQTIGALLDAVEPPAWPLSNVLGEQDRRVRKALRAAQRALAEPGVRDMDELADELGSPSMRAAAAQIAQDRALAAVRRSYRQT